MYKIIKKEFITNETCSMYISAPDIARNALAGQFIILMPNQKSERIPLTIAGTEDGLVRIVFQIVGATTYELSQKEQGEDLYAFTGPLGKPTELDGIKSLAIVGGGLGAAICLPLAIAANKMGIETTNIMGFRNIDLIMLEDEFKALNSELTIMTDDGSNGNKGFVTTALEKVLSNKKIDKIIAIGPLPMMRAVGEVGQKNNVPTIVSMNSIMIDGTGMCGACRLTVGGETKFACVDGPDFYANDIDWVEAINRSRAYLEQEKKAYHECKLLNNK